MKKILKIGCGSISYNEDYICAGGNRIGFIDRKTNEVCHLLSGIKDVISTSIDEEYLYVKTTNGIYSAYNLKKQEFEFKGFCKEKRRTSHDNKFFCINNGVILDVLDLEDSNWYAIKYNLIKNSYEKLFLINQKYYCCDWNIDYKNQNAVFIFVETNSSDKIKTNCVFLVMNLKKFEIVSKTSLVFEHNITPKCLINSNNLLLSNMEIINIYTNKRFLLDESNQFDNINNGYFNGYSLSIKHELLLIFSKKIYIYDIKNKSLLYDFDCEYGSTGALIDNKIFIGTWNGLYLLENMQ